MRGTADGYLIALDMADGSLLWSKPIASAAGGQYFSDAAADLRRSHHRRAFGRRFRRQELGRRVQARRPASRCGSSISSPIRASPAPIRWQSAELLKHGGGSLWTPLSLDAKAGIVYLPVGNPAPDFYGELRPGANLYTDSLVALDAKTGKLLWYRQFIPHDVHDADLSQVSPLFDDDDRRQEARGDQRQRQGRAASPARPQQPRPVLRGADHHARERRRHSDRRGRASLPGSARRHGVERSGLRSRQQQPVRAGGRLVRHFQQGAEGPADHAGHALLRRLRSPRIRAKSRKAGSPRSMPRPARSAGNTPRPRRSWPASPRPPAGFSSPATSTTISSLWMPRPETCSTASTPAAASAAA